MYQHYIYNVVWLSFSFCFYNNFDVVLLNKGNVKIIVAFSLLLGTTI